jgi:Zn-dependent protease with chaperone function
VGGEQGNKFVQIIAVFRSACFNKVASHRYQGSLSTISERLIKLKRMPSYWFAFLISVFAASSFPVGERELLRVWGATFLNVVAWSLLAWLVGQQAIGALYRRPQEVIRLSEQLHRWLNGIRWAWIPVGMLCIGWFGWSRAFGSNTENLLWVAPHAVLMMLPGLVVVGSTWATEHAWLKALERMGGSLASGEPEAVPDTRCFVLCRHLLDCFRSQAAWLLFPLLFVLLVRDLTSLGLIWMGESPDRWSWLSLLIVPMTLPWLVRLAWKTEPLENAQIRELLRAVGYRRVEVRYWLTRRSISTAMVVGFIPGARMLVLSDSLLEQLTPKQVSMVVLHELAHLRRGHLLWRLLSMLPLCCLLMVDLDTTWAVHGVLIVVGGLFAAFSLRWISHWTEFDADRYACELAMSVKAKQLPHVPASLIEARQGLASALLEVTADAPGSRRSTWMHPDLFCRVRRLEDYAK